MEDPDKKITIKQRIVFFSISESVKIELIEPDNQPSVWRQWLDKNENGGIHHLAFNVSDMEETVKIFEENGMPLISAGDFNGGSYSYNDGLDSLKTVIETVKFNK
jgi:4-hydroxyphenylpyruvate dioxygenase-like putative hemolysin